MARSRNIKPSFFTNDLLAECLPLARILFAGLWTLADREGRLSDRPKKIKAEILPYDECNCCELLNSLQDRGFITRYKIENIDYIQIVNFNKHQNPHIKENASSIPAPDNTGKILNKPGLNPHPDSLNPQPSPKKSGVFKNGNGKEEFRIDNYLTDNDRTEARIAAPQWDQQYLMPVYDSGVIQRGIPKHPGKAYIAWCAKYTKGKPP